MPPLKGLPGTSVFSRKFLKSTVNHSEWALFGVLVFISVLFSAHNARILTRSPSIADKSKQVLARPATVTPTPNQQTYSTALGKNHAV